MMAPSLLDLPASEAPTTPRPLEHAAARRRRLGQFFTPRWVAEAIVERHFSGLASGEVVMDPTCGDGRFIAALPSHVRAIGVEIDHAVGERARASTGREVILGDFRHAPLPVADGDVSALVGNPPFDAALIGEILGRAHSLLVDGGRCGLILPAYVLQTSSKVMDMAQRWSISTELMPRNLFPGLSLPITFTMFTKDSQRRMFGFYLYPEAADVAALPAPVRQVLTEGPAAGSVWRAAVHDAFDRLSSAETALQDLYGVIEGRRPTTNRHYQASVRKVLQTYPEFESRGAGVWRRVRH